MCDLEKYEEIFSNFMYFWAYYYARNFRRNEHRK